MSEPKIEPVNGGLVLSRDASLLGPGELSLAEDVMLKPGSPAIHKAPGRAAFNSTVLTNIGGIAYANFDTAQDQLVAVDSGSYKVSPALTAGEFTTLATDAGTSLVAISMLDHVVLLSGSTSANRVLLNDGTSRPHGLFPVTTAPGLVHTATGGTWPLGVTQLGWFEYWTTEVYKVGEGASVGKDEVEGTFAGTPASVNVTATTSYVTIRAPGVTNIEATHWRIYRSEKKTDQNDLAYPIGWLIADVPITQREFNDGLAAAIALTLPTTAISPTTLLVKELSFLHPSVVAWPNPNNVLFDDGSVATCPNVKYASDTLINTFSQLQVGSFGFATVTPPVTDISVLVKGSKTSAADLTAYLSWDGGTTWTAGKAVPLTTTSSSQTVAGGDWGRVWDGAEFTDSMFKVLLIARGSRNITGTVSIDDVKVSLTYNSTTGGLVTQFPNVILTISNESVPIGANGHPPGATTGDVFQGALITNNVATATEASWTIPGTVDYSPVHYKLNVGAPIVNITTIGSTCVIGGGGIMTRMNYLPVEEDPEFNTGRCLEVFDSDDGVVGLKGCCKFVLAGELMLFYIGGSSLKITNAFKTTVATTDIIWTELANIGRLNLAFVENNVLNHELLVYYPAAGSETVNKVLRLSYHESHLKDNKLKVAGITNYAAKYATVGTTTGGERRLYTAGATNVYVENRGYSDASGGTIIPRFSSREMHLAGIGSSWEAPLVGIHHPANGSSASVTLTSALADGPPSTNDPKSFVMANRQLTLVDNAHSGDGLAVNITGVDDGLPMTMDYLVLFADGLGPTTPLNQ